MLEVNVKLNFSEFLFSANGTIYTHLSNSSTYVYVREYFLNVFWIIFYLKK